MFNSIRLNRKTSKSGVLIRKRCRICGRNRYLFNLRPSITHNGLYMCQDDVECLAYYQYMRSNLK